MPLARVLRSLRLPPGPAAGSQPPPDPDDLRQSALSSAVCGLLALAFPSQAAGLVFFTAVALPLFLVFVVMVPGPLMALERHVSPGWTRRHGAGIIGPLFIAFWLTLAQISPRLNSTYFPLLMAHQERTVGVAWLAIGLLLCGLALTGRPQQGWRWSLARGLNPLLCGSFLLALLPDLPADVGTGRVLGLSLLGDGGLTLAQLQTLRPRRRGGGPE